MDLDISLGWNYFKMLLSPTLGWIVFHFGKRLQRRWIRISVRMVASAVMGIGAFLIVVSLLVEAGCKKHGSPMPSPDKRNIAVVTWSLQGAET